MAQLPDTPGTVMRTTGRDTHKIFVGQPPSGSGLGSLPPPSHPRSFPMAPGAKGLPWWLRQYKESACNAEDAGSIPESGRSPREENGNPLQYSCLENAMDVGTWQATVHGVTKIRTQLSG